LIDLHSHILPGVDDGVRSVEEARELARAAAAEGVTAIAATPHVRDDYPTRAARMESGVEELRRDFAANRIAVEVLHGGEIDLDRLAALDDDEVSRFTLAQTGRYLLLEFPDRGWPMALEPAVHGLARRRIVTVLAHPERNHEVQAHPERLELLLGAGAIGLFAVLVAKDALRLEHVRRPSRGSALGAPEIAATP